MRLPGIVYIGLTSRWIWWDYCPDVLTAYGVVGDLVIGRFNILIRWPRQVREHNAMVRELRNRKAGKP